ncbi:glycosyl transferase family 1 [Chromatium okenii]|uniref:glycosyltransferase family 4 protein n=1 Tax=Chromatium okenii TaxID=61644 RepID=UPI0019045FB6|nr:glycosyltransferase family 4 protein [Chromatium okenii]MBK1641139.1 glycosyl transferase family 1 [Chromatium okenii]
MKEQPNFSKRPLKTLLFSTLYPNSIRPNHGIFVETRLRYLLATQEVTTQVIAPVPWFPFKHQQFGNWSQFAQIPHYEVHHGIEVWHPRYVLPPKIGMNIAPFTLALSARRTVAHLIRSGFDFDVIDAHYYYPDGVAAALLAKWFNKPLFITARGTDLNLIPRYAIPRRLIQWAEQRATGSIGVCKALMDTLVQLGGDAHKTHVLRNGVDLERFTPQNQLESRLRLDIPVSQILLSVGNLIELKGHHLAIEALKQLPEATLVIIGDGVEREKLQQQAAQLAVINRVIFAGARPQTELKEWYSAADILLLCSSREGWANVLLEAMACGTPVVATAVGGTPEVVQSPIAGRIIHERTAAALVEGIQSLSRNYPDRAAVRKYAEQFDWEMTTQGQIALFRSVCK